MAVHFQCFLLQVGQVHQGCYLSLVVWTRAVPRLTYADFNKYGPLSCAPVSHCTRYRHSCRRRAVQKSCWSRCGTTAARIRIRAAIDDPTEPFLRLLWSASLALAPAWKGVCLCRCSIISCSSSCNDCVHVDLLTLSISDFIVNVFGSMGSNTGLTDAFVMHGNNGLVNTLPLPRTQALPQMRHIDLSCTSLTGISYSPSTPHRCRIWSTSSSPARALAAGCRTGGRLRRLPSAALRRRVKEQKGSLPLHLVGVAAADGGQATGEWILQLRSGEVDALFPASELDGRSYTLGM
ncbi:hypothetical protein IOCL2690_000307100 [Leishmania lindenbergi]|uniref:Uncharacterized protein n=1 Tax=Leishmania lindenbergi TaxID=651832 RepID=A0AAW3AKW9_9TRYP